MTARTLRHYCAVEPTSQGEVKGRAGIILHESSRYNRQFLTGRILSVGKDVAGVVSVGDLVVYEKQSAHPSQTGPIPATMFGGSSDKFAVVVPLYRSSLYSVAELEEELVKRQRDVERLTGKAEREGLVKEDFDQLMIHEIKIGELEKARKGRSWGNTKRKTGDTAKGSGIVAILEDANNGNP